MRVSHTDQSRCGMSLLEVIIVIGIVVLLVSLLLPSVQQASSGSRRQQCRNNLKQIGFALHNYHELHRQFPPAYILELNVIDKGKFDRYNWVQTWQTALLPFREQESIAEHIDDNGSIANQADLRASTSLEMPFYLCPQAERAASHTTSLTMPGITQIDGNTSTVPIEIVSGLCDYSNVSGIAGSLSVLAYAQDDDPATGPPTGDRRGAMPQNIVIQHEKDANKLLASSDPSRLRDFKDGAANTFFIFESAGRDQLWREGKPIKPQITFNENNSNECLNDPGCWHAARYAGGWANPFSGDVWINGSTHDGINNGACVVNCSTFQGARSGLHSFHRKGANTVLADGSARFISQDIALPVFAALITRNGGEELGEESID